jgi:hypothetical protein
MKMKRFIAFFMTVVLVVAMSVPAFATHGEFISSIGGLPTPTIEGYTPVTHECTAKLVITSWSERHTLDDATRALMEKAYNDIVNSQVINNQLKDELVKLANELEINHADLAVGILFDISYVECPEHAEHKGFNITLKPEVFENYVGILHMNAEGTWELLNSTADEANSTISFTVDGLSPFAIVYNTNPGGSSSTGDSNFTWIYVSLMVASVCALGVIGYSRKKREN